MLGAISQFTWYICSSCSGGPITYLLAVRRLALVDDISLGSALMFPPYTQTLVLHQRELTDDGPPPIAGFLTAQLVLDPFSSFHAVRRGG